MAFVSFDKETGRVTGFQELPDDRCYLSDTDKTGVGEISKGQLDRIKQSMSDGTQMEFKSGRLYEVAK